MAKIKDLVTYSSGFFSAMSPTGSETTPQVLQYFTAASLDFNFYGRFGNKTISPMLENVLEDDGTISAANKKMISLMIEEMNKYKYKELFKVLTNINNGGWDPTENYSLNVLDTTTTTYGKTDTLTKSGSETNTAGGTDTISETGTDTNARTGTEQLAQTGTNTNAETGTETYEKEGTEEIAKTGTETTTHDTVTDTSTTQNQKNAFNSASAVDTDKSTVTNDNNTTDELEFSNRKDTTTYDTEDTTTFGKTNTETKNLTDTTTHNTTDTETKNLETETEYGKTDTLTFTNRQDQNVSSGSDIVSHVKNEHGSLGVSSAIDQVIKNFEGFTKADFFDMILNDWAQMLTLPIWED